jgi:ATP-dependent RNA helicase DHX8/PRP22
MKSGQLAKDRKDIREQQYRAINEALPKDLHKIRDDPTANPAVRNLAQSLKTPNQFELPEWKKDSLAKTSSQPARASLSIRDQREGLPIFKLRDILI